MMLITKLYNQKIKILSVLTFLVACQSNQSSGTKSISGTDNKPNIVIILADDMGYSDIGCFGGEIATPNIDKLAQQGTRFRRFYNDAKCGPSRSSLLTGQYYHQGRLEVGATMAEVLHTVNYRTIMTGKWHQNQMPTDYGFDRYYGLVDGCSNFWNPGAKARPGENPPGRKPGREDKPRAWGIEGRYMEEGYVPEDKDFYTTDAFTNYAVDRLEEYKDEDKPFLLYLSYTAPHYPLHAWPDDIAKYEDTYKVGWDQLRKDRHQRMKELGVIDETHKLSPRNEEVPAWESLTKKEQKEQAYLMAVYAAMVDRMDQGIGKVMDKLKQIGKKENTIVIFMSDNGACSETPNNSLDIPPGPMEGYRSLGPAWANASNTPYRLYKSTSHEGGIITPTIISWPGAKDTGGFSDRISHFIDFVPTFMEITGAEYPTKIRGKDLLKPNGRSFAKLFEGQSPEEHKALCWERVGTKAVRQRDWKVVTKPGKNAPWELYDLSKDPTELTDLANQYPEKINELEEIWNEWKAMEKRIITRLVH